MAILKVTIFHDSYLYFHYFYPSGISDDPVPLVQGGTRWYVLVRTSTYSSGYEAVRKTSFWYERVRTDIGNSLVSTYRYVLVRTDLYQNGTRRYKKVQDGTRWYKAV